MRRREFVAAALAAPAAFSQGAPTEGRLLREWWYEPGPEQQARFRVNSPEAALSREYGGRPEVRSSGMMQIKVEEDLRKLRGAELYCELWGGHPGTRNKRVTINGRSTYAIPDVGTEREHCTHQYPSIPLKVSDLVPGWNAVQFACDQGMSFWGHFIVDNACIRTQIAPEDAGLTGFQAAVTAEAAGEVVKVRLGATDPGPIAAAEFQGFYEGYEENGNGQGRDWHGFTKQRKPVAFVGSSWDTSMLPRQEGMRVRGHLRFHGQPQLVYETPPSAEFQAGGPVRLYRAQDIPAPFWSRAGKRHRATIEIDWDPYKIERAELHVVVWDGGRGNTKDHFKLNGRPLEVAGRGRHDVLYRVLPLAPIWLRQGANQIELLSDTEHHGIEILLPGPAIVARERVS
ncbi:MAG TPA: hypothetical protein DEH78_24560 [Solibacterales bacterium]|nr:hypothetical protein [Bryobacterales bacterium]